MSRTPRAWHRRAGFWALVGTGLLGGAVVGAVLAHSSSPIWRATAVLRVEPDREPPPALRGLEGVGWVPNHVRTEMMTIPLRPVLIDAVRRVELGGEVLAPADRGRDELFAAIEVAPDAPAAVYVLERTAPDRWRVRAEDSGEVSFEGTLRSGRPFRLPGASIVLRPDATIGSDGATVPGEIRLLVLPTVPAAARLRERLSGEPPDPDANLIEVSVVGRDSGLARRSVDAVLAAYLDRRAALRGGRHASEARLLESRLAAVAAERRDVEEGLAELRRSEGTAEPGAEGRALVARRASLREELALRRAERDALARTLARTTGPSGGGGAPGGAHRLEGVGASNTGVASFASAAASPGLLEAGPVQDLLLAVARVDREVAAALTRRTAAHPDLRALRARREALVASLGRLVRDRLASLDAEVGGLERRLATLDRRAAGLAGRSAAEASLLRRGRTLTDLEGDLRRRLEGARLAAASADASVHIVAPGIVEQRPVSPRPVWSAGLGGGIGLLLAVLIGAWRGRWDDRVRDPGSVEASGVPLLGRLPDSGDPALRRDAVAGVRTGLQYARADVRPTTVLVTAAGPGAGTSAAARALSRSLREDGERVLLLDADVRRGGRAGAFGPEVTPGLTEVLTGECSPEAAVRPLGGGSGDAEAVALLPAGRSLPTGPELLAGERMEDLLAWAAGRFDRVIVDAPPLLAVSDALALAPRVDGVIGVVRRGSTRVSAWRRSVRLLERVGADVLGVVYEERPAAGARGIGRWIPERGLAELRAPRAGVES